MSREPQCGRQGATGGLRAIGRHGRLSPDYARRAAERRARISRRPSSAARAAGRLKADYQQAVAELVNNPAALFRVVLDERFDGTTDPAGRTIRRPKFDASKVAIACCR